MWWLALHYLKTLTNWWLNKMGKSQKQLINDIAHLEFASYKIRMAVSIALKQSHVGLQTMHEMLNKHSPELLLADYPVQQIPFAIHAPMNTWHHLLESK